MGADEIPSSCCSKYNRGTNGAGQVGDCSEAELKSKPGCGQRFNKFFRDENPNLKNPLQPRMSDALYVMAILMISLAWIFSLQVIEKKKKVGDGIAAMAAQNTRNTQNVFTVSSTLATAEAGTSFR